MKILALADEPEKKFWDGYAMDTLRQVDLILSCGDLPAAYLSYLTTFSKFPVVYVHGNHDQHYREKPPEGCINAEGHVVLVQGIRILGLGGSMRYRPDHPCMFSEEEMASRIRRLRRELKRSGLPFHDLRMRRGAAFVRLSRSMTDDTGIPDGVHAKPFQVIQGLPVDG